jgi:hypothetical protein
MKGNMNQKKMLVKIWSANYCFFFPFTRVFSLILHSKQSISNPNNHNQLVAIFKLSLVQKKINKSVQHAL